jgi:hypothetical protein
MLDSIWTKIRGCIKGIGGIEFRTLFEGILRPKAISNKETPRHVLCYHESEPELARRHLKLVRDTTSLRSVPHNSSFALGSAYYEIPQLRTPDSMYSE